VSDIRRGETLDAATSTDLFQQGSRASLDGVRTGEKDFISITVRVRPCGCDAHESVRVSDMVRLSPAQLAPTHTFRRYVTPDSHNLCGIREGAVHQQRFRSYLGHVVNGLPDKTSLRSPTMARPSVCWDSLQTGVIFESAEAGAPVATLPDAGYPLRRVGVVHAASSVQPR